MLTLMFPEFWWHQRQGSNYICKQKEYFLIAAVAAFANTKLFHFRPLNNTDMHLQGYKNQQPPPKCRELRKHSLLAAFFVAIGTAQFVLILSRVDRRTSWGRSGNISSGQRVMGIGIRKYKTKIIILNYLFAV